jgi:hypothetical protein
MERQKSGQQSPQEDIAAIRNIEGKIPRVGATITRIGWARIENGRQSSILAVSLPRCASML